MTDRALEESIRKWRENLEAEWWLDVRVGWSDCPLCQIFNNGARELDDCCVGCPVMERTEQRYCHGSPYWEVHRLRGERGRVGDEGRAAIQAEVEFLEGLRGAGAGGGGACGV